MDNFSAKAERARNFGNCEGLFKLRGFGRSNRRNHSDDKDQMENNNHLMQKPNDSSNFANSGIDCCICTSCTVSDQVVLEMVLAESEKVPAPLEKEWVASEKVLADLEKGQVAMDLGNTMKGCHRHNIHTISGTTKPSTGIPNLDVWGTTNSNRGTKVGAQG
jgi:hypothetical protein